MHGCTHYRQLSTVTTPSSILQSYQNASSSSHAYSINYQHNESTRRSHKSNSDRTNGGEGIGRHCHNNINGFQPRPGLAYRNQTYSTHVSKHVSPFSPISQVDRNNTFRHANCRYAARNRSIDRENIRKAFEGVRQFGMAQNNSDHHDSTSAAGTQTKSNGICGSSTSNRNRSISPFHSIAEHMSHRHVSIPYANDRNASYRDQIGEGTRSIPVQGTAYVNLCAKVLPQITPSPPKTNTTALIKTPPEKGKINPSTHANSVIGYRTDRSIASKVIFSKQLSISPRSIRYLLLKKQNARQFSKMLETLQDEEFPDLDTTTRRSSHDRFFIHCSSPKSKSIVDEDEISVEPDNSVQEYDEAFLRSAKKQRMRFEREKKEVRLYTHNLERTTFRYSIIPRLIDLNTCYQYPQ